MIWKLYSKIIEKIVEFETMKNNLSFLKEEMTKKDRLVSDYQKIIQELNDLILSIKDKFTLSSADKEEILKLVEEAYWEGSKDGVTIGSGFWKSSNVYKTLQDILKKGKENANQ